MSKNTSLPPDKAAYLAKFDPPKPPAEPRKTLMEEIWDKMKADGIVPQDAICHVYGPENELIRVLGDTNLNNK